MAISSPGIGSNLDINSIVNQLMQAEAQPLAKLTKKEASYQARISAYGSLKGSLSAFQSALATLSDASKFQSIKADSSDAKVFTASASSKATAGAYNINVTQLARGQTLVGPAVGSLTSAIGSGADTTLTFQFGEISGGTLVGKSALLSASAAASGIPPAALSINGTNIATGITTNSAKELAAQINLSTGTTGVTATAAATDTGILSFGAVSTGAGDAYSLVIGSTTIASIGASASMSAEDLDIALTSGAGAAGLATEGITVTGSAAAGTLRFTRADGSNIRITQSLTNASGTAVGGIGGLTSGTTSTYTSSVSLSSASEIKIGGANPTAAGFAAGAMPTTYSGAAFAQDSNKATATVKIDSSNNTLQGIRDTINAAGLGVTASIVSDGSATPHHLVLTSNKTGTTSSMKISVSGDAALSNLLAYDPTGTQKMQQSSSAQSTLLSVNGIAVSSATQTVTDAIQGTTLTVNTLGASTLTVARDTAAVESSVNSFVKAYNDLNKTINTLTAYNPTTKEAGLLLGDAATRQIQSQIKRMMGDALPDAGGSFKLLTQIGIKSNSKDGSLSVDSAKLKTAINSNFDDIAALFATQGKTTDSLISYAGSSSATKPGTSAVNITTLATQGKMIGNAAAGLTITEGENDELSITVDGVSATVKLAAGTYTAASLAAQVQSAINGASGLSSSSVAVTVNADAAGIMTITSNRYGSASNVAVGGNGLTNLLGATPAATLGVDVAGTINGIAASGSGQTLTGAPGSLVEGLKLTVTGGATGERGTVSFSHGYATQLSLLVNGYTGNSGSISSTTEGLNRSVKDIEKQRAAFNTRLTAVEKRYRAQFAALDKTISSMSQTTNFLTQQLSQLSNLASE